MDQQTKDYVTARDKLRIGMQAMLEHYAAKQDAFSAEFPKSREASRLECRDHLIAEIANKDDPPLHFGIPANELSEAALWALSEALSAMWTDKRTWENKS